MNETQFELICERVHYTWIDKKLKQGIISRRAEDGEELMVGYKRLSEKAKDLDRDTVRTVLDAVDELDELDL